MARTLWPWLIVGLIALGYLLPYTILSDIERWYGAFLFWVLFGVAVWLILSVAVLRWTGTVEEIDAAGRGDRP